jgi:hypothetical protein
MMVVFVSGCASINSVSLSQADKLAIGDVMVVCNGKLPEKAFYQGPENQVGAVFGVVGALVASDVTQSDADRIVSFVKENHIDLGGVVKSEFIEQLSKKPAFANKIKDNAASKFVITIVLYGMSAPSFSSELRPYLVIESRLINESGREIWRQRDYVASHGSAPALRYADFLGSPETFTSEFKAAAKEVVGLSLQSLD